MTLEGPRGYSGPCGISRVATACRGLFRSQDPTPFLHQSPPPPSHSAHSHRSHHELTQSSLKDGHSWVRALLNFAISLRIKHGCRGKSIHINGGLAALDFCCFQVSFFFRRRALHSSATRIPVCGGFVCRVHPGRCRAIYHHGR